MKSNRSKFSKLFAGLVVSSLALSGVGVTFAAEGNEWSKLVEQIEYNKTKTNALRKTLNVATENALLKTFVEELAKDPEANAGDILKNVCTRYKSKKGVFAKRQIVDTLTAVYGGYHNILNYPEIVQMIELINNTPTWDNVIYACTDSIYNYDYIKNLKK